MKPIHRLILAVLLPLLVLVLPAFATAESLITVCVSGPPTCDYDSIQAAIDAANFGDTVVVSTGTYTEQLTLKSGVTLTSTDGPTSTIVTANNGPIISAELVTTTQILGLTIRGSGGLTEPIGLQITGGELVLSDCVIEELHGQQALDFEQGVTAYGVYASGVHSLLVDKCSIRNITGGDEASQGLVTAGSAYGMWIEAADTITVTDTLLQQMTGGAASLSGIYACQGVGGRAVGIHAQANSTVVQRSNFRSIDAGKPCFAASYYCWGNPGTTGGIEAIGGQVTLQDNSFVGFSGWVGHNSKPNIVIHTTGSQQVTIEGNHVDTMNILTLAVPGMTAPQSPYCAPPPGSFIGIASENDAWLTASHNTIQNMTGLWDTGQAIGIQAIDTQRVQLTGNTIFSLTGGSGPVHWPPNELQHMATAGIAIDRAFTTVVDRNIIRRLQGGTVPEFGYNINPVDGGRAVGLALSNGSNATIRNNIIWNIVGGEGNEIPYWGDSRGGDAYAISISNTNSAIVNNTLYQTTPGASLSVSGTSGSAIGISLTGTASMLALNNIIAAHGIGISITSSITPLLGYNDLWNNSIDYAGVVSGTLDLYSDPRFKDSAHGDFRLTFSSPLIDHGFTPLSPSDDLDGNLRPIDGNGDGVPVTDIGAYEYQPVPLNRHYLPVILH